jgi:hypothetical protein
MSKFISNSYILAKVLIAIVTISALIGVASADMAPEVSLISILIVCAIVAGILLVALCIVVTIAGSFNQAIIRNGGTDPAWFWFNGEPPGLEKQRAVLKALIKK